MAVDKQTGPRKKTRIYQLEAARGFAAVYVFANHYAHRSKWHIKYLLSFSTAAVMVFFLISGFVVYASAGIERKPFVVSDYARKRIIRILPPYLCAITRRAPTEGRDPRHCRPERVAMIRRRSPALVLSRLRA